MLATQKQNKCWVKRLAIVSLILIIQPSCAINTANRVQLQTKLDLGLEVVAAATPQKGSSYLGAELSAGSPSSRAKLKKSPIPTRDRSSISQLSCEIQSKKGITRCSVN